MPEANGRSEFRRDYDRIIFSSSFRRLADKTQVFPLSNDDSTHTRLTHSLEVSTVGYSLGHRIGRYLADQGVATCGEDVGTIVSAACLAHDIGNPPFGHSGEAAIQTWAARQSLETAHRMNGCFASVPKASKALTTAEVEDLRRFEGNAQGFRILAKLHNRFVPGGLRPTLAIVGAMAKYPCESVGTDKASGDIARKKFGFFQSEKGRAVGAFRQLGLLEQAPATFARHPLAFLVEAADDICYSIIDLEDSFRLKIVPFRRVKELLAPTAQKSRKLRDVDHQYEPHDATNVAALRSHAIQCLVEECAEVFLDSLGEVEQFRAARPLVESIPSKADLEAIQAEVRSTAYRDPRVLQIEYAGFQAIFGLLQMIFSSVHSLEAPLRDAKLRQLLPG